MMRYRWFVLLVWLTAVVRGEDGYRLWLRYDRITDESLRKTYASAFAHIIFSTPTGAESPTLAAARDELKAGLGGLLAANAVAIRLEPSSSAAVSLGDEGYELRRRNADTLVIVAPHEIGILYGVFALLRQLEMGEPTDRIAGVSAPQIQRRVLNHWDNLNGSIERGYAGQSLWNWFDLPDIIDPRYRDYARTCASIGINGTVLTNVNADALILTPRYLEKVAALAHEFRPYGVRVYLPIRFSAPVEGGGLKTADPLDPAVAQWWREKAEEIYRLIPDFGGFLVKANSEGEPGPQTYGRSHAEGANLLADAVAPHGGIVMWRAFVYDDKVPDDRAKQAYNEFHPLDGKFRANVAVQIKNGPIDFMPREAFHPLFGAIPHTSIALELQITQEYLGHSTQVAFLAPLWKEVLDADTFTAGPGSTVATLIEHRIGPTSVTMIAGVANTGSDRNWCGHPLAAANWYAYGRLAWDPGLSSSAIADEWTRQTFGNDPRVVQTLTTLLLASREAVVDYSMPLGLHHIMAEGHHYGPGPWVDHAARADWTSVYYHRADAVGLGFDRTATGSNALSQYAPEVAKQWGELATCPDEFLLWFHHLPWDYRMRSGHSLWDDLCLHYQRGVNAVRDWEKSWNALEDSVDPDRFVLIQSLLRRQEHDACDWRDACTQYFQTFSHRALPAGVEAPAHPLAYYEAIQLRYVPGSPGGK